MEPDPDAWTLLGMDPGEEQLADGELWSLVLAEDGNAFGLIFDRYRDRVFRHSLRLVRSAYEAEDVTAMVFLEVWRCRKRVHLVNGSLLGWLLVTTNNVARNHRRSTLRYGQLLARLPSAESYADHSEAVAESADAASRDAGVKRAFLTLSKRDQEIILLCVLEELSTAEVAQILKIPPGTVKSRLSRAKTRLGSLLRGAPFIPPTEPAPEESLR